MRELTTTVRFATQATLRGIQNRYLHLLQHLKIRNHASKHKYLRKAAGDRTLSDRAE